MTPDQFSFFLMGAALMVVVLGLITTLIMSAIDRWSRRFFIGYFSVLILYIGDLLTEGILVQRAGTERALEVMYFFESLALSVSFPMLTAYVLHCSGEDIRKSSLFRAAAGLWLAIFVMMSVTLFTNWFYYALPGYEFGRGPLYWLIIAAVEAMLVLILAGVIRRRNRMPRRYYQAFLIGLIPMTVVVGVHFFTTAFVAFGISVALCALSMFGIILTDQLERSLEQQREIARQQVSILVLQMRPHFIYNTMMSIYYLCKQDPDLAQRVTLDFTTYLRKNFTAIASEKMIPFTEELEHTRAYLAVEQAQFEDNLFVEYDTPHTDFRLPPLTLQPIVENAVKHGMDPDSEPLHISVRTARTDAGSEIAVENTGAEFESAGGDGPHTALKNIRQRLEIMCGGKMTITPRKEGGTVVRITIPDRDAPRGRETD